MPYVVSTTLRVSNNPVCLSVLRNEDLKEMLESNKESLKLEAMKRVVGVSASWESTFLKSLTASRVSSKTVVLFDLFSADCQREEFIGAVSCCCEERGE